MQRRDVTAFCSHIEQYCIENELNNYMNYVEILDIILLNAAA